MLSAVARYKGLPLFLYIRGANLKEVRILQITKKFPWPVRDGEVMAILNLTRGFAALGHQVTILALNTQKHYFRVSELPENIQSLARFIAVDIDTSISPFKAFFNLFSSKSYNIERFYSPQFDKELAALLQREKFDLILLEGIYLMRYIKTLRLNTTTKIVLRLHNVEYKIWEGLRDTDKNPLRSWYLGLLARRMKRFELAHINLADGVIMLTQNDEDIFVRQGCKVPHASFPIAYVFDELPAISDEEENAVAFIGGMDWLPNREGVDWFIAKVWPEIIKAVPGAKFYLAGRNFPVELKQMKQPGITVMGEVDDARQFILSKPVFIVPLFAGSGMRAKIIEALALGRAIVSTPVGAEGIAYTDGENILIAGDEKSFAAAIIKVLQQPGVRKALGEKAQQLVRQQYDNHRVTASIIDFCKPLLN